MSPYASAIAAMEADIESIDLRRARLVNAIKALRALIGPSSAASTLSSVQPEAPAPATVAAAPEAAPRRQPPEAVSVSADIPAAILTALRRHGGTLSPKELQESIGKDKVTTAKYLEPLLVNGTVLKSGVRRGVKLTLAQKPLAPARAAADDLETVWNGSKGSPSLTGDASGLGSSLSGNHPCGREGAVSVQDPCGKRIYLSERAAKEAHRRASYRVRPYYCDRCRGWHVTNSEKRHSGRMDFRRLR